MIGEVEGKKAGISGERLKIANSQDKGLSIDNLPILFAHGILVKGNKLDCFLHSIALVSLTTN